MVNGIRQNVCERTGLSRKVESNDEIISFGAFIEANAANDSGGKAAAMEDLTLPMSTNSSCRDVYLWEVQNNGACQFQINRTKDQYDT